MLTYSRYPRRRAAGRHRVPAEDGRRACDHAVRFASGVNDNK